MVEDVAHQDGGPENTDLVAAHVAAADWPLVGIGDRIWTGEDAVES
ncbi:MAG: hypothetical protein KDB47_10400 [Mycobacterium sp.]|nr:hypothetical protein [Mycobacterium sp.]